MPKKITPHKILQAAHIPSPPIITSVTVAARCAAWSSMEALTWVIRAAYAHSSSSQRLRCVRAFIGLPNDRRGVLAFFLGGAVIATAPTEQLARQLLEDCLCADPKNGLVSNVFAAGVVGYTLDLDVVRKASASARFDGVRAHSVLRISLGSVQLDAFSSGRYTVKGPSEQSVKTGCDQFLCFLGNLKDFSQRMP